jgi:hypothetical protein
MLDQCVSCLLATRGTENKQLESGSRTRRNGRVGRGARNNADPAVSLSCVVLVVSLSLRAAMRVAHGTPPTTSGRRTPSPKTVFRRRGGRRPHKLPHACGILRDEIAIR